MENGIENCGTQIFKPRGVLEVARSRNLLTVFFKAPEHTPCYTHPALPFRLNFSPLTRGLLGLSRFTNFTPRFRQILLSEIAPLQTVQTRVPSGTQTAQHSWKRYGFPNVRESANPGDGSFESESIAAVRY